MGRQQVFCCLSNLTLQAIIHSLYIISQQSIGCQIFFGIFLTQNEYFYTPFSQSNKVCHFEFQTVSPTLQKRRITGKAVYFKHKKVTYRFIFSASKRISFKVYGTRQIAFCFESRFRHGQIQLLVIFCFNFNNQTPRRHCTYGHKGLIYI